MLQRRVPSGAAVLQTNVTNALMRAFCEEWAAKGLGALSIDAVVKRANVGKAALYRRWPNKTAMAVSILEQVGIAAAEAPDTGSLAGDLALLLLSIRRVLRHPLARRIVPDMLTEMARVPEFARDLRGRLKSERRGRARLVVQRAVDRGELETDAGWEIAADAIAGIVYWRMIVTNDRIDTPAIRSIADFIAAGLRK